MVTADINKDGIPDLIASNDNGAVTLLRGNGNGSFGSPVTLATLAGGAAPVAVGDFNVDGVPDLAVLAKSASSVWIYLGHGDGTFATPMKTSAPASPAQIAVADVNGDGHADVVAASVSGLSAFLGDGQRGLAGGDHKQCFLACHCTGRWRRERRQTARLDCGNAGWGH